MSKGTSLISAGFIKKSGHKEKLLPYLVDLYNRNGTLQNVTVWPNILANLTLLGVLNKIFLKNNKITF